METQNIRGFGIKHDNYEWILQLRCTKCGKEHEKDISFFVNDQVELMKGFCNFKMSCRSCKCEMRIDYVNNSIKPLEIQEGSNKGSIASFEVKNCTLLKWTPSEGIFVIAEDSDKLFMIEDFDVESWCDVDPDSGNTCVIEDFKTEFEKA